MGLTEEQKQILSCTNNGIIIVNALAGTGKTSTLLEWCKQKPHLKILYLVFGKAMADEAKKMFKDLKNVHVKTTHSLAFKSFGVKYKSKLTQSYRAIDCMRDLDLNGDYDTANSVLSLFNKFLSSDSDDIYKFTQTILRGYGIKNEHKINSLSKLCDKLWKKSIDLNDDTQVVHDFYLKLYQMSKPNLGLEYDVMLVDECVHGDMYIVTEEGDKKIKTLHDKFQRREYVPRILSYNEKQEIFEYKNMNFSKITHNREILTIKTEGLNKIKVTGNHPILTQRGYVEADQLICGQDYVLLDTPENQKSKLILNDDQTQIVIGSFLGDGAIDKRSQYNTYRVSFTHGEKQKQYLEWKTKMFNIGGIKNIKSGYTGKNNIYQSNPSKTFILNEDLIRLCHDMDSRALAIWYMDDGSYSNESGCCVIHSNAFGKDEHLLFQFILKNNFGIHAEISITKGYYYLRFNKSESQKLLMLIKPYMHEDLYYKNPLCYHNNFQKYQWDNKFKAYGGNFITSIESSEYGDVYDIGVEDNHNFIIKSTQSKCRKKTTGIIVHNCQDSTLTIKGIIDSSKDKLKQVILIGDPHQSIFQFRNCVNLMDIYSKEATSYDLTGSFRVNQDIANMCNMLLDMFKKKKVHMSGYNKNQKIYSDKGLNFENMQSQFNIITRTNATILAHAIEASMRGKWLYFEGGYNSYPFQFYKDLYWFRATNQTYNKELNKFKDWEELQQYATEADDIELLTGIKFINMYSSKVDSLPNAIDNVKNYVVSKREQANFCYCTAHKSKGLTFKTPTLIEKDFPHLIDWQKTMTDIISMSHIYPDALDKFLKDIEQDVNLAYVAITRAKGDIYLNEDMVKFFNL